MNSSMTIWYNPNHPEWYDEGLKDNLNLIKEAGFSHINWNPDAGSSYLYNRAEMEHIKDLIIGAGLRVKSFHAAHGHHSVMEIKSAFIDRRKDITSPKSWRQEAGIELIENRLIFAGLLNCDNVVLHIPLPEGIENETAIWQDFLFNVFNALDRLQPISERENVAIAIENLHVRSKATESLFSALFSRYPKEYIGWCYDSGHAQNTGLGFDVMDQWKDRLIATHLHDNRSAKDDHLIPGDGVIDWEKSVKLIAESSYKLPLNFETPPARYSVKMPGFYERAFTSISNLTDMVEKLRK